MIHWTTRCKFLFCMIHWTTRSNREFPFCMIHWTTHSNSEFLLWVKKSWSSVSFITWFCVKCFALYNYYHHQNWNTSLMATARGICELLLIALLRSPAPGQLMVLPVVRRPSIVIFFHIFTNSSWTISRISLKLYVGTRAKFRFLNCSFKQYRKTLW